MNNPEQAAALEYKLLLHQFQKLQQNIAALEQHIDDLKKIQENIETIATTEVGKETLIPLGSGIFIKGTLSNNKELLMNVGANVCLDKPIPEALQTVAKQAEEVGALIDQLEQETENIALRLEEAKKAIN